MAQLLKPGGVFMQAFYAIGYPARMMRAFF